MSSQQGSPQLAQAGVQTPGASRLTAAWGHLQLEAELEKKKSSMESSPEPCLPEARGLPGGGRTPRLCTLGRSWGGGQGRKAPVQSRPSRQEKRVQVPQ